MKKFILLFFAFFIVHHTYAQRFQQYNAVTYSDLLKIPHKLPLFPNSSRQFAFNFFIPNFYVNTYIKGNAQASLKSRWFLGYYDNDNLQIGQGKTNALHADVNVYILAFKAFTSLNGKQEIGFSYQVRGNARGTVTDETVGLLNGSVNFSQPRYTDVFNSNASYQMYHQFSAIYREQVTKNLSVGVKLSSLFGISYNSLNITNSYINFNNTYTRGDLGIAGSFRSTYLPGEYNVHEQFESIQNPGAAISVGATYKTNNGLIIQGNLRDLGFIHWRYGTFTDYFNTLNSPVSITGLRTTRRETNVSNSFGDIVSSNINGSSFNVPITGYADLSVAKKFGFNDLLSYTPTVIVSKQTFSQNLGGALVNQVQYGPASVSLSGIYNYKLFDLGLQLMYKTPNFEFFAGSEQLTKTINGLSAANKNTAAATQNSSYSGAGLYVGFSMKFGRKMERWRNESYIPTGGEQGPLGRAWTRIFNSN